MKKFAKVFSVALLVIVLAFAFAGCDKSGNIKKAYENEGYTVTEVTSEDSTVQLLLSGLTDEQKAELSDIKILYAVKGINVAAIIKFGSSSDVKSFLTTSDGDTSAYDSAKENDMINGNCYLITLSSAAKLIFKNA